MCTNYLPFIHDYLINWLSMIQYNFLYTVYINIIVYTDCALEPKPDHKGSMKFTI